MFDFGLRGGGGGARGGGGPGPLALSSPPNALGGKAIIKYNPSNDEITAGIRQNVTLFTWQSPDGQPHFVTIEVGRVANGIGGPDNEGAPGQPPATAAAIGAAGGGTWPAGADAAGNPLYYRPVAQILLGTGGTMQDPFFIDINRGQRFTACVSYVAVTALMRSTPLSENTGLPVAPGLAVGNNKTYVSGSMAVYATLGIGYAISVAPLLYTQYIDSNSTDSVAGSQTYTRITPPRANLLLSAQAQLNGTTMKINFDTPAEPGLQTPPFTNAEMGVFGGGLPISGDGLLTLLNYTTGLPENFKLIYQISV